MIHTTTTQPHNIQLETSLGRATESDVFLLLGDSSTTSSVADGLVRGPRRASDDLDRCERTLGEQVGLRTPQVFSGFYPSVKGFLGHFKRSDRFAGCNRRYKGFLGHFKSSDT